MAVALFSHCRRHQHSRQGSHTNRGRVWLRLHSTGNAEVLYEKSHSLTLVLFKCQTTTNCRKVIVQRCIGGIYVGPMFKIQIKDDRIP